MLSSPEHGQEYDEEEDATLTIHIGPWDNVIVLDIQKLGQMKSLGFVHGMGEESTQHEITKNISRKSVHASQGNLRRKRRNWLA